MGRGKVGSASLEKVLHRLDAKIKGKALSSEVEQIFSVTKVPGSILGNVSCKDSQVDKVRQGYSLRPREWQFPFASYNENDTIPG